MKGLKLSIGVFKENGEDLTVDEFIEIMELNGLEIGGSLLQINEDENQ